MIKILLVADTHLGFDHPVRPGSKRKHRGDDFFNNFKWILDYALLNHVDLLIHGGDFFYRSRVPQKIVTKAYEILFEFAEKGIPFIIVPGNHERSELPVSILTRHPNIYIFSQPDRFRFNFETISVGIYGFPFIRENIRDYFPIILRSLTERAMGETFKILCFHQSVEGAKVGSVNYTFRSGPDVIQMKDIPLDFDLIFSGHIHRRQILFKRAANRNIPVIYPGSIERTSFAEKGEVKGFYLVKIDENKISLSPEIEFIQLPTRNMEILSIPHYIKEQEEFRNWLTDRISVLEKDSIIKFINLNSWNSSFVTKKILEGIIPSSMYVQYSFRKR